MSSQAIQQIDVSSVHKICSGQVVLDLGTAVKELVENSLDADACNVEIRLKEHGKELIEVSDDGSGILEDNFEGLALKHHTSKLRQFSDLTIVDTYGFRGEALSSLSALSNLVVTTQNEASPIGYKLEFDHNGKLVLRTPAARERGTTVSVSDLFHTLPVRYKEFQRNFKKDFTKLCHIIYAYALVNPNVRFTCTNTVNKKKTIIASTKGNQKTLDVIISLFGISQSKKIEAFQKHPITEDVAEEYNLSMNLVTSYQDLFDIRGFISNVTHGFGRSAPDRQFYFVNTRPCDHQKTSKIVNEMYHRYNNNQYPFVFLEILTNKDLVDVNITPDKRQVMLQQEKVLYALIKTSLKSMFDQQASLFVDQSQNRNNIDGRNASPNTEDGPKRLSTNPLAKFRCKYAKECSDTSTELIEEKVKTRQQKLGDYFSSSNTSLKRSLDSIDHPEDDNVENAVHLKRFRSNNDDDYERNDDSKSIQCTPPIKLESQITKDDPVTPKQIIVEKRETSASKRPRIKTTFNLQKVKRAILSASKIMKQSAKEGAVTSFRAKISAQENGAAEEELRRHVSKEMFSKMTVIGQFNLGFITAKLNDDLFIIDQHASDEKYNFETLQKKHILKTQTLIQPIPLEITPVQKHVLLDNIEIFKKNGFCFDIKDESCLKIISTPVHRNWVFGASDVEELIFILSDSSGTTYRPSRVRQMFASRACRTSIMVGTALSKQSMVNLLRHMGEIEHPWNCPHGRPTMRHLINLKRLAQS
ncbi:mismatch repair endonuclease PMS2-like [Clytia hemisphaerica]|uniref:mismatch repair endonuclease PMS2-like n=1 Tax=Clytia hemisphaerica TaxID=252671 RepID=UPI0034D4ED65